MRPNLQLFIILSIVTVAICQQRYDLTSWDLNIEGVPNTFHITTPSTLSQNLINLQKVSRNPYYRDNFLQFYKYQTKSLLYTTTFTAPQNTTTKNYTSQIIFQGLDTHATVYLNGQKILTANNMFRKYIVNVNLHSSNKLVVQFQSAATHDIRKAKEFQNQYGFALPQNYSYSRKAAYQYGWDWGPRILTSGIWKDAYVLFGIPTTINNPIPILTTPITTKYPTTLSFNVTSQIHIPYTSATYNISMLISRNNQFTWCDTYTATLYSNSTFKYNRPCQLTSARVKNVSQYVWWTWDLGEPNMFNLTIRLQIGNNTPIQKRVLTGLKTVKVIQEKDTIGTSFTVNLNGYDIFIRGGNYIPPQMSMSQIPNTTYARIKTYAEFAKYNMIRVWGGGQFQHDEFYHVMDTAGILIWHDLMFACAMYPIVAGSDDAQNIRMEMQDNLWRIGYHPSIGIWNGNNQVWIGWQEWGWKNKLDHLQIIQAQKMYKKIFSQTLPQVINHITPHIFYWQTSPSSSSNQPNTITSGDIHFWRVWGAGTDIQQYQIYVGRFNSEYGMQSMPEYSSILKYTAQQDRVLGSQVLRLHERHPLGDKYLPMYTNKYAGVTQDLKRFAYFSQVMQAYALQMAIVSLRGNKPYCMGSIYWQLNDVWPVSSWSTVDYYGQYKIAHYRIRQLHDQLLIHVVHTPRSDKGDQIFRAVAVNDYDKKISLFCVIRIMDFNGTILKNIYQVEKTVTNFQNIVLMRFDITPDLNRQRSFIHMDCKDAASGQNYTNIHYFVPPAQRVKLDPKLNVSALGNRLTIRAENLASYVWIRSKYEYDSHNFNKNYFDLLPGQEISVMLPIDANEAEVTCYQREGLKEELEKQDKESKKRDKTLQSE